MTRLVLVQVVPFAEVAYAIRLTPMSSPIAA